MKVPLNSIAHLSSGVHIIHWFVQRGYYKVTLEGYGHCRSFISTTKLGLGSVYELNGRLCMHQNAACRGNTPELRGIPRSERHHRSCMQLHAARLRNMLRARLTVYSCTARSKLQVRSQLPCRGMGPFTVGSYLVGSVSVAPRTYACARLDGCCPQRLA